MWLSLTYEWQPEAQPTTGAVVGLDRGVTVLAADSNGQQHPRLAANRKRRRVLQRRMARRMPKPGRKGSKRYYQAKAAHARFLEKEQTRAVYELHRITTEVVRIMTWWRWKPCESKHDCHRERNG